MTRTLVLRLAVVMLIVAFGFSGICSAATESMLINFTGGGDGGYPGTLVEKNAEFYGTTALGGSFNCGTVFKLTPSSSGWQETVLHNFDGGDGAFPSGPLTFDSVGNIYGVTNDGGAYSRGNVFELSPNGDGTYNESSLFSFSWGTDGGYPVGGLALDRAGNLYGMTFYGGLMSLCQQAGCGVVFKLTPGNQGWTETILHNFSGEDGALPAGSLTFDLNGNLYGVTTEGGTGTNCSGPANGCGVAFRLAKLNGIWKETVLHSFNSVDGSQPSAGLVFHGGDLYGTTLLGGKRGWGTVFRLANQGANWKLYTLAEFSGNGDGGQLQSNVIFDTAGNLYGTTDDGGGSGCGGQGCGTIYKLTYSAGKWTKAQVQVFNGTDGSYPASTLVVDSLGRLFGTAQGGGQNGWGLVFEVVQ